MISSGSRLISLITMGILALMILGAGIWSESTAKSVESTGHLQRPLGLPFEEIGVLSLDEVRDRSVNVLVDTPDLRHLPLGYSVVGTMYENSSATYVIEGREFSPEIVNLLIWDRPLTPDIGYWEFLDNGGIYVTMTYALGSNETVTELFKTLERDLVYIRGFPTLLADGHIELYQFKDNMSYDVIGNHPNEILMRIMLSLIRG